MLVARKAKANMYFMLYYFFGVSLSLNNFFSLGIYVNVKVPLTDFPTFWALKIGTCPFPFGKIGVSQQN